MLDVVLAPARALEIGTDVPGRVAAPQGGSAATTARWLARLGVRSRLVCAVGRDAGGGRSSPRSRGDGVRVRATASPGSGPAGSACSSRRAGSASFVADRGAADRLAPGDLPPRRSPVDLLHLPAYSLLGEPLGRAGRRAIELARAAGALVSLDLSSVGPLLADGRRAALRLVREAAPDVLFATAVEAEALVGRHEMHGARRARAARRRQAGPRRRDGPRPVGRRRARVRRRDDAARGGRHDRRRRCVRCRVPRRVAGRGAGRAAPAGDLAPGGRSRRTGRRPASSRRRRRS